MKQKPLTKTELEDLHSVLRRAAERAERNRYLVRANSFYREQWLKADAEAEHLASAVADLADELASMP